MRAAGSNRLPGPVIETHGLSKLYGDRVAVDDLSFTVRPGRVTGFLGPNGAGKTTTMRLILGLDSPSGGSATINGKPFAQVYSPMREVVRGLGPERAGEPALANGIAPHYLAPARVSLEEAFMELTADSVGYHAKG
jgi:ABC-2 type transport system ATP-binding protein